MADDRIAIRVEVEGAEKGTRDLGSLADKVKGLEQASRKSAREVTKLETALERERAAAAGTKASVETLTAAEGAHAAAMRASGATMQENSIRTGRLVSAFGSMGSAMTLLGPQASRLGGALSAVGSSIANTTTTMGPFGIVLGVVTVGLGLLVPALSAAREETEELGASAMDTTRKLGAMANMAALVRQAREGAEVQRRRDQGLETLSEIQTRQATVQQNLQGEGTLSSQRQVLADLRTRLREAEGRAGVRAAARTNLQMSVAGPVAGVAIGERPSDIRAEIARQEAAIEENERNLSAEASDLKRREIAARTEVIIGQAEVEPGRAGRRRRGRRLSPAAQEMVDIESKRKIGAVAFAAAARETFHEEVEQLAEMEALEEAAHNERIARMDREKQKRDEMHQAELEQQAETVRAFGDAGAEVGSFFTSIYGQMINDQKSFEEAFVASFKKLMIEKGSEAVFDGTKMIFEGIGMLINPATSAEGALKIAAGGGMIALGVAAGAAGAAISVPGGGGAPASPRASSDAGGGGEKTIVLNMNGPLLTAQTEAGVGRSVTRSLRQAERVYGSAAA